MNDADARDICELCIRGLTIADLRKVEKEITEQLRMLMEARHLFGAERERKQILSAAPHRIMKVIE